jgi:hypothetical protein
MKPEGIDFLTYGCSWRNHENTTMKAMILPNTWRIQKHKNVDETI